MNKISMASSSESGSQYPYPSTLNPASFVSIKLSGAHDYPLWETQMMCLVESQELVGFIDGTILTPPEMTEHGEAAAAGNTVEVVANEEYRLWKRSDRLVKSWILGSLQEIVLATVLGLTTARSVWTKLHSTFGVNPQENIEEVSTQQDIRIKEYPYPSTFNVANVLTIKLTKANYMLWLVRIKFLLEILDMGDFLTKEPPSEVVRQTNEDIHTWKLRNQDYLLWKRTDKLLQGWIIGSISEDAIPMRIFPSSATTDTSKRIMLRIDKIFLADINKRTISPNFVSTEIENKEEFPYPSTFNVASIVTIKLTKANYKLWVKQIWSLVSILKLRDFLEKRPPDNYHEWCLWKRTDKLLQGWILATLSEDVLKIVSDSHTSRRVMIKIEETFVLNIDERILSPKPVTTEIDKSIHKYMSLYKATLAGDWEATKRILVGDKEAETAIISENHWSLLHVAVETGKHFHFVENLVQHLPMEALNIKNKFGSTALLIAATVGNTEAAKILMKKNPALLSDRNYRGDLPLHTALDFGHTKTYLYLQSVSKDYHYVGENARRLLSSMILSKNFDLALDLVKRYPHAAELESSNHLSPLCEMAEMPSCFRSGMRLNFLQSFIYSCVPVKFESFIGGNGDVENPANNHHRVHFLGVLWNSLKLMIGDAILLVPSIKIIYQKKLVHHQAVQLVKCLCKAVKSSNGQASFHNRSSISLTAATTFGTVEVVEEILHILPHTIWSCKESNHTITEIAVINRCEKVFNIKKWHSHDDLNSILHLAGQLAPRHKLNLVSGAALQMQRELQWFKDVNKLANPYLRAFLNSSKETPAMVFKREHKELVIEGEKWMKDTANSCSIAAALIITMVFAAAITVPGGNKEYNGLPVFYNDPAFLLFAFSDTFALFMSTTSLLMFLSILTARYAEEDFLHTLPKRLVAGLLTLFLSITSMVIAFSSVVYLVFGGRKGWVIIPLVALSFLPIFSFARSQFPLFIDVYSSTYGRGRFGKQSERPFHRHIKGLLHYINKCFASTQKYLSHILSSSS